MLGLFSKDMDKTAAAAAAGAAGALAAKLRAANADLDMEDMKNLHAGGGALEVG